MVVRRICCLTSVVFLLPKYLILTVIARTTLAEEENVINIVTIGELHDEEHELNSLTLNIRCVAHTFNLIVSLDSATNLLKQTTPDVASFKALNKIAQTIL
ncbi:UNVERIFIED_CONTAM: hypothetical protein RMT77_010767 [Armadillidium vulgare]